MTFGIFLFAIFALVSLAVVWTVKLANTVPAMQDMMPSLLPGEQFFIVFAKRQSYKS